MQARISCLKKLLADHTNNHETDGDKLISQEKDNRTDYVEDEKKDCLSHHLESLSLKQEKDVPTIQKLRTEVTFIIKFKNKPLPFFVD